jgi:predicted  nucleic acid-binding Zn-ribbon protein
MSVLRIVLVISLVLSTCAQVTPAVGATSIDASTTQPAVLVSGVQKVVQMLGDIRSTAVGEKKAEEVRFAEFHKECDETRSRLQDNIAVATSQIEKLQASADDSNAQILTITADIEALHKDLQENDHNLKTTTAEKDSAHADWESSDDDAVKTLDAIKRAIEVLKARSADVPQAALAQLQTSRFVPDRAVRAVESLLELQGGADEVSSGPPQANAYEFQSQSVIDMLKKIASDITAKKNTDETEYLNANHNFERLMQQYSDNIDHQTNMLTRNQGLLREEKAALAETTIQLQTATKEKADFENILSSTTADCSMKSEEFEKNQVTRKVEIDTLQKAIEVLQGEPVQRFDGKTAFDQVSPALVQLFKSSNVDAKRGKAIVYLQQRADALGSRSLSSIVSSVQDEPFTVVIKMIKDLIGKLKAQHQSELELHGFCTTELTTNHKTREIKTSEVDDLNAHIAALSSEIEQLDGSIVSAENEVSEITNALAEATQNREAEKAANAQQVTENKEAQDAVERAIRILEEFYGAESQSSLDSQYKGRTEENTGVVGLLQVILSQIISDTTTTESGESRNQASYEKVVDEQSRAKALLEQQLDADNKTRSSRQEDLASANQILSVTEAELTAALDYQEELKVKCNQAGSGYDSRKTSREEEIASLHEALEILGGM